MKYIIMCLVLVLSFSIAEKIDMPAPIISEGLGNNFYVGAQPVTRLVTPEIAELQAKMDAAIERGDYLLARQYDRQIVDLRYGTEIPAQPTDIPIPHGGPANSTELLWGTDRLIWPGTLRDFAVDYDTNGTMYVAISAPDSNIKIYRSTNHGLTWNFVYGVFHTPKDYYTKIGLVATQGDSGFLHLFCRHRNNNGDIYLFRIKKDFSGFSHFAVATGPDTVSNFSVCEDYYSDYYLYLLYANELRGGTNARFVRSVNYGVTFVDSLSWGYGFQPSIAFGSALYLHVACRVPPGYAGLSNYRIFYARNLQWGSPTHWQSTIPLAADTFDAWRPSIAATNTRHDSLATVWVLYTHNYYNTGDLDLDYAYSTNGGRTFTLNQHLDYTTERADFANIRQYRVYPNEYVNACFSRWDTLYSHVNIYWRWASRTAPTVWSTPQIINDHRATISFGGKINYSPNAPATGGGIVYATWGPDSLYFDAPWVGIEELPPVTPINNIISVNPNPFTNQITINYQINKPGKVALMIYDAAGREVKSITNGNIGQGDYRFVWNGKDNNNRTINNGVYFLRLKTDETTITQKLIYSK